MNGSNWRLTHQFICEECRRKNRIVMPSQKYQLEYPCEMCKAPTANYRARPNVAGKPMFFSGGPEYA